MSEARGYNYFSNASCVRPGKKRKKSYERLGFLKTNSDVTRLTVLIRWMFSSVGRQKYMAGTSSMASLSEWINLNTHSLQNSTSHLIKANLIIFRHDNMERNFLVFLVGALVITQKPDYCISTSSL